jgi:5-methylcytosine-specific restriction endonuclease McrA
MPTHPARARQLLKAGRAVVARRAPFTIRLKDRTVEESAVQPVRLKLDPGSKVAGIAIVREADEDGQVLHLAELRHKQNISKRLKQRAAYRRRRRSANLRYRPPRFLNRARRKGWPPPSLRARVDDVGAWVDRYRRLVPISAISVETARFDTQKLQNPEISGVEYQQGELHGYEVREYLLEKWGRKCAYCGRENVPLQVEHIVPKSRGGSNRVSNLTLSCGPCNQKKGSRTAVEFGYPQVQQQVKRPLRDTAAVNSTRWAIYRALTATGLPVEVGTGGRTKYNRSRLGLPKTHAFDALCVGKSVPVHGYVGLDAGVLRIRAMGRGSYQRTQVSRYGFPRGYLMRHKSVQGFRSGDLVRAVVLKGKCAGTHEGSVVVRRSGYFAIRRGGKVVADGVHARYFRLIQRADGYSYSYEKETATFSSN